MNSVNCFCKILDVLQGSEYMSAESVIKFKADNGNNSKNMLTSKKINSLFITEIDNSSINFSVLFDYCNKI